MDFTSMLVTIVGMAGIGLILLNGSKRAHRLRNSDPLREVQQSHVARAASPQGLLQKMELRIHEYGREVEARIENRLTALDRLIVEADQEISRLEALLVETRMEWPPERPLTPAEQQRCFALLEAGFSVTQTARYLHTTPAAVQAALDEWQGPQQRAA